MNSPHTVPDTLPVDPYRPLADYAGFPLACMTWKGERLEGVTELGAGSPAYDGKLIIRFPDGGWAHANFRHQVGAPTFEEHMDAVMRAQIADDTPWCCSNVDGTHWSGCDCTCHEEPTPAQAQLEDALRAALPHCRGAR